MSYFYYMIGQMGETEVERLRRELTEARAALRDAEQWAIYPPRAEMSREKWLLMHAAAIKAARVAKT